MQAYPLKRRGVTMIELLLIMAIISLLMSVVLPSVTGTVRTGQRVACLNNLRELARGAAQYGLSNEGWIIGAPGGSGAYLRGIGGSAFGPAVQRWDFMGPMSSMWNMGLPENSGSGADCAKRFDALRSNKLFRCPANGFIAMYYSGPMELKPAGWMVSYNTCRMQMWIQASSAAEAGMTGDGPGLSWYGNTFEEKLPPKWRPSISRIGNPANKVFCADGARYSDCDTPPDFEMACQAPWGGSFSDPGAYYSNSKSWDRSRAPGNGNTGPVDARMYAFRHSVAEPPVGAPANAYLLNLAFYDGHVETKGDLDASNPTLWLPAGTVLTNTSNVLWPDAVTYFNLPVDFTIPP